MLRKVFCLVVIGLLNLVFLSGNTYAEKVPNILKFPPIPKMGYVSYPPIRINSDTDTNWTLFPGHYISGLEINGTGFGYCVFIGNCSLPFTVKDCYLHNASGESTVPLFNNDGLLIFNSSNGSIIKNNISYNNCGINIESSNNISFSNIEDSNNECGIIGSNSNLLLIENNKIFNNNYSGILFDKCINSIISNNQINSNIECGIYLSGRLMERAFNNTVSKNNIYLNGDAGIYLDQLTSTSIIQNNVYSNQNNGLTISSSDTTTILYNNITDSKDGINFDLAEISQISYNNISSNKNNGIFFTNSSINRVTYNKFSNNVKHAIYLAKAVYFYSDCNSIHHNNFICNNGAGYICNPTHVQAYDNNDFNWWNTTTEGNYWSDWTTPDDNPSNLIVDYPYNISGGTGIQDYYPLVYPVEVADAKIPNLPTAPQNLTAVTNGSMITLMWEAPVSYGGSSIKYNIYHGFFKGGEMFLTDVINVLTYNDTGLLGGTYYYKVCAENINGEGPFSNEASAEVDNDSKILDHITISQSAILCECGDTINFTAKAYDTNGNEIIDAIFYWIASPSNIGTINAGTFVSTNAGSAIVTVSCTYYGVTKDSNAIVSVVITVPGPFPSPSHTDYTFLPLILCITGVAAIIIIIIIYKKPKQRI